VLQICATDTELDLSGSPAELRGISIGLAGLRPGERCKFTADVTGNPAPYDRLLDAFEAIASDGPVCVSVAGKTLLAIGCPEMLAKLASFFWFSDSSLPGSHSHHEWWEGNEYIAKDSRPLVISLAKQDAVANCGGR
jgi:hypothetical protein